MNNFKNNTTIELRIKESSKLLIKYPNRVPVIVHRNYNSYDIPKIDKNKYLVPNDLTVGQFLYIIRKRLKIKQEKALFVFVDNTLPNTSMLISELYDEFKDEDGFLYVNYTSENTFGFKI